MTSPRPRFYGDETPKEFIKKMEQKGYHFTKEQKEKAERQEREQG